MIEMNRQKQMLDEVEEDPSIDKLHIAAIKAKIKANQANRLHQKKLADERLAAEGAKNKQQLIAEAVARNDLESLDIEDKMDSYTEADLIPQYPGRSLDPRGAQSLLSKRVNTGM